MKECIHQHRTYNELNELLRNGTDERTIDSKVGSSGQNIGSLNERRLHKYSATLHTSTQSSGDTHGAKATTSWIAKEIQGSL